MANIGRNKLWLAAAALVVAAAVVAGVWWQRSHTGEDAPTITAHRWERVIVLERFDGTTWKPAYEVKKTGTGVDNLVWPTDVPPAGAEAVGAMRPGQRIELFYLDLGALGTCRVSAEVWRKYLDGSSVPAAVRGPNGTLVCRAL